MSDRAEIESAVTRMLFAIDRLDWSRLRDHFADKVQIDYTSLFGGEVERLDADVLLDRWRGLLPGFDATQHMTGPIIVTSISGREAVAETHVRGYHYIHGSQDGMWMVAGHYTLQMHHAASGWLVAGIRLDVYRQEGNKELLAAAIGRAKSKPRA